MATRRRSSSSKILEPPEGAAIDALADRLRPHYSRFLGPVDARGEILLTGHSHQAWPDVARDAQVEAWDDAARLIDNKWDKVFGEVIPELQGHIAKRIGSTRPKDIAIAQNTHELVYRLATCFPNTQAVVTTDSEFHSLRRQLARFAEDGLQVVRVPVEDPYANAASFASRFIDAVDRVKPSWVALSYVLFTTSRIVTSIGSILDELARRSIPVLVDAYHAFNTMELSTDAWRGDVFVTGGGYKYAECGEGACWMLLPESARALRPRYTGWFSHFESLEARDETAVAYGDGGYRFFGATFDPTSIYRAVRVFRFMDEMGLTPEVLRAQSLRQTTLILERFDALGLAERGLIARTPRNPNERGAFVSIQTSRARLIAAELEEAGVRVDLRGDLLRLGPAPYLRARSIRAAMEQLHDATGAVAPAGHA